VIESCATTFVLIVVVLGTAAAGQTVNQGRASDGSTSWPVRITDSTGTRYASLETTGTPGVYALVVSGGSSGGGGTVAQGAAGATAWPMTLSGVTVTVPVSVTNVSLPVTQSGAWGVTSSQGGAWGVTSSQGGAWGVTASQGSAANSTAGWPVTGGTQTTSATWTSATGLNTALTLSTTGYSNILFSAAGTGTFTTGAVTFEGSLDGGSTWFAAPITRADGVTAGGVVGSFSLTASSTTWLASVAGMTNFRIRLSTAITGTGSTAITLNGSSLQHDTYNLTNLVYLNGSAIATNTGAASASTLRVVTASDATTTAAPWVDGGRVQTTTGAAATNGAVAPMALDKYGKLISWPCAQDMIANGTFTLTATTASTILATTDTNTRYALMSVYACNTSTAPTRLDIRDNTTAVIPVVWTQTTNVGEERCVVVPLNPPYLITASNPITVALATAVTDVRGYIGACKTGT
jgi:hypothetical protein